MLLFLTTISTPIAKDVYFLEVGPSGKDSSSSTNMLRLGTLGYCLTDAAVSVVSMADATTSGCTPSKLGYSLDYNLFKSGEVWGTEYIDISHSVLKSLTYMLILQPIGKQPPAF